MTLLPTADDFGPVSRPTPDETAVIRGNLYALARDAGDAELLCAAIVGAK